jgi:hypothetical protein
MLNQPINVIPSVLSGVGEGVVDATLPLVVSWQVSGDTPMLAYKIVIQQNDTDSTEMYDTGKVVLANPFYGNDSRGNMQMFSADEITAAQLSTAGIVNGYENGYKIIITQWWGSTNDESITQTSPSVFITRETPTLGFVILNPYTPSNPYTQKDITITADFQQDDGDTIDIDGLTKAEDKLNVKQNQIGRDLSKVDDRIMTLIDTIGKLQSALDNNNSELESLKAEFEKRNPTQTEKLNLRSLDSYPFNVKPTDYWADKAKQGGYEAYSDNGEPTTKEYVITNDDVDNPAKDIADTFFKIEDDDIQTLDKLFGL